MQSRQLPAGYLDASGVLHRDVELRALTGREEELLALDTRNNAAQVTQLLGRCIVRLGAIDKLSTQQLRELLVGDRHYLLLMLRQLTMGDRVQATLPCPWPACGRGVDIDFNISQIPITPCADVRHSYLLSLPRSEQTGDQTFEIEYRLPTGEDQEAIVDAAGPDATTALLARCVLRINAVLAPSRGDIEQLTVGVRRAIEQDMEARAPNLDLTMDVRCPACERHFVAPFVLQDFFFSELRVNAAALCREVHYLAFHYHWSEQEIMQMTRTRRRQYIDVLSAEIETLNAAAE